MDQVQNDRRSFMQYVVQSGGNVSRRRGPSGVSSMLMFCLKEEQSGGTLQWPNLVDAILVAVHCGQQQAVHASIRDAREVGWDHFVEDLDTTPPTPCRRLHPKQFRSHCVATRETRQRTHEDTWNA